MARYVNTEGMSITSPLISRARFIKNIRDTLKDAGIDVDYQTVAAVLRAEEKEILMVIANEKRVKFEWGSIQGMEVPPKKITGPYSLSNLSREKGGFSKWKRGFPKVLWTKAALDCDNYDPGAYFSKREHKYTSNARKYRKNKGLPEIEEFEGLSEEKIQEICEAADKVEKQKMPKSLQNRIEIDKKNNHKASIGVRFMREIIGNPMFVHSTFDEDVYGDYQGSNGYDKDIIDWLYEVNYEPLASPPNRLELVRRLIDLKNDKYCLENPHDELYEKEKELVKEVKEKGYEEIPHTNFAEDLNKLAFEKPFNGSPVTFGSNQYKLESYINNHSKTYEMIRAARIAYKEDVKDTLFKYEDMITRLEKTGSDPKFVEKLKGDLEEQVSAFEKREEERAQIFAEAAEKAKDDIMRADWGEDQTWAEQWVLKNFDQNGKYIGDAKGTDPVTLSKLGRSILEKQRKIEEGTWLKTEDGLTIEEQVEKEKEEAKEESKIRSQERAKAKKEVDKQMEEEKKRQKIQGLREEILSMSNSFAREMEEQKEHDTFIDPLLRKRTGRGRPRLDGTTKAVNQYEGKRIQEARIQDALNRRKNEYIAELQQCSNLLDGLSQDEIYNMSMVQAAKLYKKAGLNKKAKGKDYQK